MPRAVRSHRLESEEGRRKLKQANEPYWVTIHKGVALGYRKGANGGTWHTRARVPGAYRRKEIGIAADNRPANGTDVLDYWQAQDKARQVAEQLVKDSDPQWQAQQEAAKQEAEAAGFNVRQAAELYLAWYKAHKKAYDGTKAAVDAHILPKLGDKPVRDLTAPMLRDWHRALATKAPRRRTRKGKTQVFGDEASTEEQKRARRATANRILTVLKALLNKAFQDEKVPSDSAWRKVKPFKGVDEPVIRFLTPSEAKRLLNACTPQFRPLVAGALSTGARYSELTELTVGDYDPRRGSVYFKPGKSGRGRHVPLTEEGRLLFERLCAGKTGDALMFPRPGGESWGKNHQVRPLTDACKVAKIVPAITFHELRHTFASALINKGVELPVIAKLLGHADTRITLRHYAHIADRTLTAAMAKMPKLGIATDSKVKAIT